MKFEALGLTRPILDALQEQGVSDPHTDPGTGHPRCAGGAGRLGCARTGTGKTCAFAAPILQRLAASPGRGRPIRALILTPTRELAIQIQECFEAYGAHLALRSVVIFGGVGQNPQVEAIQAAAATSWWPPRAAGGPAQPGLHRREPAGNLRADEADRMLDMGFIHDVKKILTWLPRKKQTLFFSATMPREISQLVDSLLHDPVKVAVDPVSSPVEVIDQSVYLVDKGNKSKLLVQLLEEKHPSALVFTRTKHGANRVAQDLTRAKISAAAIHGNKSQTARQAALARLQGRLGPGAGGHRHRRPGAGHRGSGVRVQLQPARGAETYVHRIGRTGRAGKDGIAISFCDYGEKPPAPGHRKAHRQVHPGGGGSPLPHAGL